MKSDTKPQQQIGQLHRKTFHSVFFIPLPQVSIPRSTASMMITTSCVS